MKRIVITSKRWATHCRVRGDGYAAAMAPALMETLADGSMAFDADHPAWRSAAMQYREDPTVRAHIEKQWGGCKGCGQSGPDEE